MRSSRLSSASCRPLLCNADVQLHCARLSLQHCRFLNKNSNNMLVPRASLDLALPFVKSLPECADFSKTVQPYLPQLYDLPYRVIESINDRKALLDVYTSTNPLMLGLAFSLVLTVIVLVVSEINRNYSQVDRLWSILPVIYNVHYDLWAHLNGLPTAKIDHIMALSVIWGARLTFNYWRKGGYQVGSEDYRWNIVKDYVGPIPMFIFNIVFISLSQNVSVISDTFTCATDTCCRSCSGLSRRRPTYCSLPHVERGTPCPPMTMSSASLCSPSSLSNSSPTSSNGFSTRRRPRTTRRRRSQASTSTHGSS